MYINNKHSRWPCLFYLLLFILWPLFVKAQFQEATLTLMSGETLQGYLKQDGYEDLRERIEFKQSLNSSSIETYSPKEVSTFQFVDGERFRSIPVTYERNEVLIKDRQFAKVLAIGPIDLYLIYLNVSQDRFVMYVRKDGDYRKLSDEPFLLASGNYTSRNSYRGILRLLANDCDAIDAVEEIDFTVSDLLQFANSYNDCLAADYQPILTDYVEEKESHFLGEVFAGIIRAEILLDQSAGPDPVEENVAISIAGIGAQWEILKPRRSRKFRLHQGVEGYKWFTPTHIKKVVGDEDIPEVTLAARIAGHFIFDPNAKNQIFGRLGASFVFDIGSVPLFRPSTSWGIGNYFSSGNRVMLQYEALGIITIAGFWRVSYAHQF